MITLFNVVSEDGFIARMDGNEDFIPDSLWPKTLGIFKQYDTLVMGRNTYESLQQYPPELLGPLEALPIRKVVVSGSMEFRPKAGYEIARTPESAVEGGGNILVCSGPALNNALLRAKLADRVLWQTVPVSVGEGMRPYDPSAFPDIHPERI